MDCCSPPRSLIYVDRQTLSWLAPYLKQDYHWTNTDYANLVIGFRAASDGKGDPLMLPGFPFQFQSIA